MEIKIKYMFLFPGLLIACFVIYAFLAAGSAKHENIENTDKSLNKLEDVVFEVKTAKALKGDLVKYITANGMAKAFLEVDVTSNLNGYVKDIPIYEGKKVRQNELLLKLDDKEYLIAIKEAESKLQETKIQYVMQKWEMGEGKRTRDGIKIKSEIKLLDDKYDKGEIKQEEYKKQKDILETEFILSGAERDKLMESRTGLSASRINLERAELNLSYTKIQAPFSGVIADLNLAWGQRVSAGDKLCKLLYVSKIKIDVGVLESDVPFLEVGNKAEINFFSLPGKAFFGKIIYINPAIDPETKTCRTTIEIENSMGLVKPGMFATVRIQSGIFHGRTIIPKEALLFRDKRNLVFVWEGGLAKWRYIEIGQANDRYVEISEGVEPGEEVIVEGNYNLAHDAKIKVIGK